MHWKLGTGNWKLHTETRSASTRRFRIRVVEDEPAADERRVVVECGALNELITLRVDEHLRALGTFENVVAFARRSLPRERVAQTGTSAGFDADAKPAVRDTVPGGHLLNECGGVVADLKHIYDQNSPILVP